MNLTKYLYIAQSVESVFNSRRPPIFISTENPMIFTEFSSKMLLDGVQFNDIYPKMPTENPFHGH